MSVLRLLIAGFIPTILVGAVAAQDDKDVRPEDVGLRPIETRNEKTGFVIGGVNKTGLIRSLGSINGEPVAELEAQMRPGKLSTKGFLGAKEKLLDILAEDNDLVLDTLKTTHQQLALHMHVAAAVGKKQKDDDWHPFRYRGTRFRVKVACFRGIVDSPFNDETKTNCEATVENLDTGKRIRYSLLLPLMIERYGFYEGRGTPYRVEPRAIAEVFEAKAKER